MKRTMLLNFGAAALFGVVLTLGAAGCVETPVDLEPDTKNPVVGGSPGGQSEQPGAYVGDEDNTFNHMSDISGNGARDPFDILAQRQEEGPPEVRTRLHSCKKIEYGMLRNILTTFGVDLNATGTPQTAGQLFKSGGGALGVANYDARVGETITWTAAGAAKFFDIFSQAAPEIIANLPNVDHCKVDGVGPDMFDADNHCNPDAVTCLIGRPATESHIAICNNLVDSASEIEKGKRIAVATLMSAAHYCE